MISIMVVVYLIGICVTYNYMVYTDKRERTALESLRGVLCNLIISYTWPIHVLAFTILGVAVWIDGGLS